jgi:hypothetical protein
MMVMPAAGALGAAKHDIAGVVDKLRGNIYDRILTVILFAVLHLLLGGLAASKRLACSTGYRAVLTPRKIGSHGILLLVEANAPLALQHEFFVADFGDEVIAVRSVTETVLVVCKRAALAVYKSRDVIAVVAHLAARSVTRAERVTSWEVWEYLANDRDL